MRKENSKIFLVVLFAGILAITLFAETPVQEGYVDFNGGQTWYKILGETNTDAIPLVVIHGGPGLPHYALANLYLIAIDRPVIFYDQQGCGKSSPLTDSTYWTVDFFVEELKALIKHLNLQKYHLLGQSWGTMILADYVMFNETEGLEGIIFSNPVISAPMWNADGRRLIQGLSPKAQSAIYESESSGDYSTIGYQNAVTEFYNKHVLRADPWPEYIVRSMDELNIDIYLYMWGASEFTCLGTLQTYDRTPYLSSITNPTLFICGEFDEATPESTRYYKRLVPRSKLEIIEDASHMCFIERPNKYRRAVRDFLDKVDIEVD